MLATSAVLKTGISSGNQDVLTVSPPDHDMAIFEQVEKKLLLFGQIAKVLWSQ